MDRRNLLKLGATGALSLAFAPELFRGAFAATSVGVGPYGPLGGPDANGIRLPAGFGARALATSGQPVPGTDYVWPGQPDGAATFLVDGGGWRYVCNSEEGGSRGGASVLTFDAGGEVVDAYRILGGTKYNCAGGATPWGTWLSCEEFRSGRVWECYVDGSRPAEVRPALGRFSHEAAVVDPLSGDVYLTEDADDRSRFYRFQAHEPGNLVDGVLQAASVAPDGSVSWVPVPTGRSYRGDDTTPFARGEGMWYSAGYVYFTTTSDNRVWMLDVANQHLEVIYDAAALGPDAPLREPDNVTVHAPSGDLFVAEDDDDLQLVLLGRDGDDFVVAPFLQLVGHGGSELAGPAFSPDGTRLYVSSQRGTDGRNGITYEITGPFRTA